jgi:hypothetical protein
MIRITRRRGYSGPLPGTGPWRILDECPADRHNTIAAATGGKKAGVAKCVCPRARDLAVARLEWRREYDRLRETRPRAVVVAEAPGVTPAAVWAARRRRYTPDLSAGACRTPYGEVMVQQAQSTAGTAKVNADRALKWLCQRCTERVTCATWVLAVEDPPPGSWGGVIGGLSPSERRAWHKLNSVKVEESTPVNGG